MTIAIRISEVFFPGSMDFVGIGFKAYTYNYLSKLFNEIHRGYEWEKFHAYNVTIHFYLELFLIFFCIQMM